MGWKNKRRRHPALGGHDPRIGRAMWGWRAVVGVAMALAQVDGLCCQQRAAGNTIRHTTLAVGAKDCMLESCSGHPHGMRANNARETRVSG